MSCFLEHHDQRQSPSKISLLLISVLIFFAMYAPPFLPINTRHILGALSLCYFAARPGDLVGNINMTKLLRLYVVLGFFTVYLILVAMINGESIRIISYFLYWMVDIVPVCILIVCMTVKSGLGRIELLKCLLIAGTYQGVISFLSYASGTVQLIIYNIMLNSGSFDAYRAELIYNLLGVRIYGWSLGLTFDMAVLQAMLAVTAIFMSLKINIRYLLFVPLLAISGIINARTSMVVFLVAVPVILLYLPVQLKGSQMVKVAAFALLVVISVAFFASVDFLIILGPKFAWSLSWLSNGVLWISSLLQGQITGIFILIFDPEWWVLPKNVWQLLFGVGIRVMGGSSYGAKSDVGFINDIWQGGLIFAIGVYVLVLGWLYTIYKKNKSNIVFKFLPVFFGVVLLVCNIKGQIFSVNCATFPIVLLYCSCLNKDFSAQKDFLSSNLEYSLHE